MKNIILIDFESSGLARGSFPIEVAWAGHDLTMNSHLIRPSDIWLDDDRLWDPAAERLHGLSIAYLKEHGDTIENVAHAVIRGLNGATVYSNNPLFDQDWLHRLLAAAGCDQIVKVLEFNHLLTEITDIEGIQWAYQVANATTPATHRAAQDVLNLWEVYRQCNLYNSASMSRKKSYRYP